MRILKELWAVLVALKNVAKVLFIVWVWMPLVRGAKALWNASFGPCCDNPQPDFTQGHGFAVSRCRNCGATRTYPRAGF